MPITNADPRSSTPGALPYPIHRLNKPQSQLWFINHRQIAAELVRLYPGGVGVLVWSQHLIAVVNPRGAATPMPPPFKWYPIWMIANKPTPPECPCADYIDPEVQGPWRERGTDEHHPHCQFEKTAVKGFLTAQKLAVDRMIANPKGTANAQERPDEWIRIRDQIREQDGVR